MLEEYNLGIKSNSLFGENKDKGSFIVKMIRDFQLPIEFSDAVVKIYLSEYTEECLVTDFTARTLNENLHEELLKLFKQDYDKELFLTDVLYAYNTIILKFKYDC